MKVEITITGTGEYNDEYTIPAFIAEVVDFMKDSGFSRESFAQSGVFQPEDDEVNWMGVFEFEYLNGYN